MIAKHFLSVCLVLWSCSVTPFRFQLFSSRSLKRATRLFQPSLSVVRDSFADEVGYFEQAKANEKLLYTIPNSPVPVQSVVSYVHKWALEASATGASVKANEKKDGVNFSFSPSPNSYLNVYVDSDRTFPGDGTGANVFIRTSFGFLEDRLDTSVKDQTKKAQVHSLIRMIAQTLIDSLANDIGSLIMNMPSSGESSSEQRELSPQEREEELLEELEEEQAEYDANILDEDEENLRSQIYSDQKKEELVVEKLLSLESKSSVYAGAESIKKVNPSIDAQIRREQRREESEKRKRETQSEKENLPTEKELMREWTTEIVSDDEKRKFITEMMIRRESYSVVENEEEDGKYREKNEIENRNDDFVLEVIRKNNINVSKDNGKFECNLIDSDDSIEDISEIQAFMKRMEMNEDEGKSFENDFETIIPPTVLRNISTPISISQKYINDDPKNIPGMVARNVSRVTVPQGIEITANDKNKDLPVFSWTSVDTDRSDIISYIQGKSILMKEKILKSSYQFFIIY